ncbi:thioredoxin family protein [Chamaesiphon polymorphus]|uniref:Thiol:disulfide interchange protein n=1 Tax=Chamaesiphon polymorphus CCALA 037 TaxID=2107692 RepID=A0A2T1GKC4_9CYAN|nr:thioredoxin family protein [Chamaesiphon polymorphus]PSB58248.1 thiol:disulfide interchange protein [Chamaesiphon polymorphus CCALA 037]
MQSTSPAQRMRNFAIVTIAIVLVIALVLGVRAQNFTDSLEAQAKQSQPLDIALTNGKPTLMEFYADWCTSCQAMAPDLAAVKSQFSDRVNFSMLNVDNTKWLPEVTKYRVDGIPHFVFFDNSGRVLAQAIGEQPRQILESKLTDLLAGNPLSDTAAAGEVSKFIPKVVPTQDKADPRAHG